MASLRERVTYAFGRLLARHSRAIFAVLRRLRPLIATRRFAIVTRSDDVHDVLADSAHFGVPDYNAKMTDLSGPFILGLDDTPLYRHDHAALRAAIRSADVPDVAAAALADARERVAARGRIDIVTEFVDPVIERTIADYFGTPTQVPWSKAIFEDVFLNLVNSPQAHERAVHAAAEMRPHLDAQIAARRAALDAGGDVPDDVLTRLLRAPAAHGGLHEIAVRHNLIGLIAGWIPTVSQAFPNAIEALLDRPDELERAQAAARAGDQALVGAYVFEALRFRPQTWALLRTCVASREVAPGTRRSATVRTGSKVLIATQSAMFDGRAVPSPRAFRIDRPFDGYLHFGHGLHACFGLELNRRLLPALMTALLEGERIERADGPSGRIAWDGAFPRSLTVTFAGALPSGR